MINKISVYLTLLALSLTSILWLFPKAAKDLGAIEKLTLFAWIFIITTGIVYGSDIIKCNYLTLVSLTRDKTQLCKGEITELVPILGLGEKVKHLYLMFLSNDAPLGRQINDVKFIWNPVGQQVVSVTSGNSLSSQEHSKCSFDENNNAVVVTPILNRNQKAWAIIETIQRKTKVLGRDVMSQSVSEHHLYYRIFWKKYELEQKFYPYGAKDGMWISNPKNIIDFATVIEKRELPKADYVGNLPVLFDQKLGKIRLQVFVTHQHVLFIVTNEGMIYEFRSDELLKDMNSIRIVVTDSVESPIGRTREGTFINCSLPVELVRMENFFDPNRANVSSYPLPARIVNFDDLVYYKPYKGPG